MFDWWDGNTALRMKYDIIFNATIFCVLAGVLLKVDRPESHWSLRVLFRFSVGVGFALGLFAFAMDLILLVRSLWEPATETLRSGNIVWYGIVVAAGLYWARGTMTTLYGAVEVAIGVLALVLAGGAPAGSGAGQLVAVAAGVYVIIRGLDNVEKGLPDQLRRHWLRAFPKSFPWTAVRRWFAMGEPRVEPPRLDLDQ